MSTIDSNSDGRNPVEEESDDIYIKMNRRMADDVLSFVKQTITNAQIGLDEVNPDDKMRVAIWKNGLNFWNDVKDAIENAQDSFPR